MSASVLEAWSGVSRGEIGIAVAIGVISFLGTLLLAAFVVLRLPEDYFTAEKRPLPLEGHSPTVRWAARIARNLAGLCLIVMGVLMSLPGVPGQGLLTILLGVMLTDLPGKRKLERGLVRRPLISSGIQKLRARYGRPPIELPD